MSRIARVLHDAWCAITKRCGWNGADRTPVIQWLQEQEREAHKSTNEIRRRRAWIEQAVTGNRERRAP